MHVVSDSRLMRDGWTYSPLPGGGMVGYPADMEPVINWKHIDGPLLYTSNGRIHWLTLWERLRFAFGFETIGSLDQKHR
jgi:hypothetical protein